MTTNKITGGNKGCKKLLVVWLIWKRFGFFVASYRGIKK